MAKTNLWMQHVKPWTQLVAGLFLLLMGVYVCYIRIPGISAGLLLLTIGTALVWAGVSTIRGRRFRTRYAANNPQVSASLLPHVISLQNLGFFKQHSHLSADALIPVLLQQWDDDWGGEPFQLVKDPVSLALLDPDSAAHWDMEMDPLPGYGGYTEFLNRLSRISNKHFIPQQITETLSPDDKLVDLRVQHKNGQLALNLRVDSDWMDPELLKHIDQLLDDPAYSYCIPTWGGQDILILCLTKPQRKELTNLKWPF